MKFELSSSARIACLIAGLAAGMAALPMSASAQDAEVEKCYGISAKGQDDGMASGPNAEVPGTSTKDYDGQAFKYVKQDTCETIKTPKGKGSLKPF